METKVSHFVEGGQPVDLLTTCGNTGGKDLGCAKAMVHDGDLYCCLPCDALQSSLDNVKDINLENVFAFTLTYKREPGGWYEPHRQMRSTMDTIFKQLKRCAKDQWMMTPELTEQGRLHWHGWLEVKDKIKFYRNFLPQNKRHGFVMIKKIPTMHDKLRWIAYCTKENKVNSKTFAPLLSDPIDIIFNINNM